MRTTGMKEFRLMQGKHTEKGDSFVKGEIVKSFRDLEEVFGSERFKRVGPEDKEEMVEPKFKAVHRGGGRYNVVNIKTGEVLNDSLLSKEVAEKLVRTENDEEE